ncbi:MAG: energy transducer TonB [Cytophagales bacterium]|nr:energy transducer TonB [Cytophagales bacterium]
MRLSHHVACGSRTTRFVKHIAIALYTNNEDGTPGDFNVIQGIGYGCDEAVVEAFKKIPKWKPATIKGKPVKFRTQMGYLYKL